MEADRLLAGNKASHILSLRCLSMVSSADVSRFQKEFRVSRRFQSFRKVSGRFQSFKKVSEIQEGFRVSERVQSSRKVSEFQADF